MKHLNPRKATGADAVPAWFLKRYHDELAHVAHDFIKASIEQCKYPTDYKHAFISPVPKVSPPFDVNKDMTKVLEKVQLKFNKHDFKINATQHVFLERRSTVSALASTTQDWYDSTNNCRDGGKGVHVVFVDFCKAFDLFDRGILLTKQV